MIVTNTMKQQVMDNEKHANPGAVKHGVYSALTLSLLLITGCASMPREAGFADVQQQVAKRLDQKVQWTREATQEEAVAQAVRMLLQDDLTMDEAVQIALLNNRALQAEYERLGIAQADFVQAGLLSNPVFSAEILNSSIGTERAFSVVEDFLNIFTLSARQRLAANAFEQVKAQVAEQVLKLAGEVRSTYYTVSGNEQAIELLRTVVGATEVSAQLAQRQAHAGTLNRLNQNLQQTLYAQALLDLAREETELDGHREQLNRLMGLWGSDVAWQVPRRLAEPPATLPPLERLESRAIEERLDLVAAKKESDALAMTLDTSSRYRFLSLFGIGFTVQRSSDGEAVQGPRLEFGLPLFDQGQAKIALLQSQLRAAQQRMHGLAVDIRSQVRAARNRWVAKHDQLKYQREVLLPLYERVLQETQLRYNGMLVGVYDLLLAKNNQINAARAYIQTLRDYWISQADLEQTLGMRLITSATPLAATTPPTLPSSDAVGDHR